MSILRKVRDNRLEFEDQRSYSGSKALFINWSTEMRLTKTLIAAALATTVGGTAFAGGFAPAIIEQPVVVIEPVATRSSWGIILPLAAVALLIALASSSSDSTS